MTRQSNARREHHTEGSPESSAGISNRESAREEAEERAAHPPADGGSPPPQDAAGREGDAEAANLTGQTSHKAGSRSVAQKEAGSRYPDRSMPSSHKVAGAFGKEPADTSSPPERDRGDST